MLLCFVRIKNSDCQSFLSYPSVKKYTSTRSVQNIRDCICKWAFCCWKSHENWLKVKFGSRDFSDSISLIKILHKAFICVSIKSYRMSTTKHLPAPVTSWMRRPTGDQDWRGRRRQHSFVEIDHEIFLRSFSPFRWFKKGSCQFLAKEFAQYWLTA